MNFVVGVSVFCAIVVLSGCKQEPTKSMEEDANIFKPETVLVDTRTAFMYTSSHVKGSVNLDSYDYLILKNPKTQRRILDPDIQQIIERLARRGLHPSKKVLLIGEQKNSIENKKWSWLLKLLEIERIERISLTEFRNENKNARYAEPDRAEPWILKMSPELQGEFIIKKSDDCFVKWSDKKCVN
ncbi:MAG: hypothetical protein A2622_00710 [Bdellovibrionales bacterium RIFCSPHIGHO2_01_FULL_40_29]|nr:MAG: hypothetical protein A2622_00710 [Bdellovibrionales bacterium RIFCSPHIGHO2_01_FULL_40_29]OFZ32640.1 MAG: hypothetical protein A3D17_05310 [Bdellovibrionales bacterium RIFCSPHIGHO2_02_FULL_40_15]